MKRCELLVESPSLIAPQLGGRRSPLNGREPELSGLRRLITPPVIALVDDDPDICVLVTHYLGLHGYRVMSFYSGDEAIDYCLATPPDLVITDVMHPGLGGPEICYRLRETPDLASTPLMILSACSPTHNDEWHALELLGVRWYTKPCTGSELAIWVFDMIGAGVEGAVTLPSLRESLFVLSKED